MHGLHKDENFFGTRTWNSMKTLGLLKNIIAMISVQYLACLLRISNALGGKPMHYIIEKSSIHCAPTGTVVCTLETPFTCLDSFHLLSQLVLG